MGVPLRAGVLPGGRFAFRCLPMVGRTDGAFVPDADAMLVTLGPTPDGGWDVSSMLDADEEREISAAEWIELPADGPVQ